MYLSCQIFEECFLEIAIFGQYVGAGFAKIYSRIFNILFFLLSSFTHGQIWLIPLVDDVQCGYIKN
jgi:hypothetical protein